MLNRLTQLLYRTGARRRAFERAHPDEPVLAAGATKAVRAKADSPVQRGARWVVARRAVLLATEQRLVCGDWEIPVEEIERAAVVRFRSTFSRGLVLKIATKGGEHYQFGLNLDDVWLEKLPFEAEVHSAPLRSSVFSVVIRLFLIAYLAWMAWRYFGPG